MPEVVYFSGFVCYNAYSLQNRENAMKKTNKQTQPAYRPIPVVSADVNVGLRMQEVVLRSKNGLRNVTPASNTRSEKQIIKEKIIVNI